MLRSKGTAENQETGETPERLCVWGQKNAIRSSGKGLLKQERGQRKYRETPTNAQLRRCVWSEENPAGQKILAVSVSSAEKLKVGG